LAVSKITMNKNWRSKQDSTSIEISAWDYERWKEERGERTLFLRSFFNGK